MNEENKKFADIAVIGMAVMGQNLILNMNDHGYKVVAFNRTVSKVDDFLNNEAKDTSVVGAHSIEEMVAMLKKPRRVMLMVKAGQAVDDTIDQLLPYLEKGDIIIDGGNTLFTDTMRRLDFLESKGLYYIGAGVSGGEEGARHGPSIMPGGSAEAWPHVKDIFQAIAARGSDGQPCCEWVGNGGAGHYVKMVHNGIEYGDMELISEAYQLLKDVLGLNNEEMSEVFTDWNQGPLDSYLIEITAEILKYKDSDEQFLIDKIKDAAGQKGTGKWTVTNAGELGQPATVIAEALFARFTSALKPERVEASKILSGPDKHPQIDKQKFIDDVSKALYASKIISYTQGYMLMKAAANEYGWQINYGGVAQMWTGGCIIRSRFLKDIKSAYNNNPSLANLLLDPFFTSAINEAQASWRAAIENSVKAGIPIPGFSSALAFYDSYRSEKLPANLIQAQRDYFGAHTYELLGDDSGQFYHANWTGHGGHTSSSTYNA
jgi:6-phosphogluconate dehydrogenase